MSRRLKMNFIVNKISPKNEEEKELLIKEETPEPQIKKGKEKIKKEPKQEIKKIEFQEYLLPEKDEEHLEIDPDLVLNEKMTKKEKEKLLEDIGEYLKDFRSKPKKKRKNKK